MPAVALLKPYATTYGRVLRAGQALYVARGYEVARSDDGGRTWRLDCRISSGMYRRAATLALLRRALRAEISSLAVLPGGARIVVAHEGLFRSEPGDQELRLVWKRERMSRPIDLCQDGVRLLFGEYGDNPGRDEVRIFCSGDGRRFEPVHSFAPGEVRHLHALRADNNGYWVLAGDYGGEPGIGFLSRDFRSFDWLIRGTQMSRAASAIVTKDHLIYGTDTELEANWIVRLEKATGHVERLHAIEGSSLYAVQAAGAMWVSTAVEPSRVNRSRDAVLYRSTDGLTWTEVFRARKDAWPALWQYGTLVLPSVAEGLGNIMMISGQAVERHDRKVFVFESR